MKVLVTGGTGYIGSHTIVDIQQAGFDVVSADNHCRSRAEVNQRIAQISGKEPVLYSIDLCDKTAVWNLFEKEKDIVGIIHFAALKSVPESVKKPLEYYRNNLLSLQHLLEAMAVFGIPNFVFSSSCTVYGNVAGSALPVTELTPFGEAECPYARTKQMGEQIITDYSKVNSGNFTLLRYFNPAGAHPSNLIGEDPVDVVTALVPRITGFASGRFKSFTVFGTDYNTRDGSCIRDFIHVMDIAAAHTRALQSMLSGALNPMEIFNLGTGNGVTVLEALKSFEKVSGQHLEFETGPRREGDVEAIYANNDRAINLLGWHPSYTLDDIMRTSWQWEQTLVQRKG